MTTNFSTTSSTQTSTAKKLLFASLAVCALTLSACADKGSATTDDDPKADAQTEVEQEATGVNDVEKGTEGGNSADTSSDPVVADSAVASEGMNSEEHAAMMKDEATVDGVDDSEVLDGSESEEHVSTY